MKSASLPKDQRRLPRRIFFAGIVVCCLAALLFAFSDRILLGFGSMLANAEAPRPADLIVVLGGDFSGNRILRAAELERQGFAPKVLSSGGRPVYGTLESELAIDFAVRHGFERSGFIASSYPALSTRDEAKAIVSMLRRFGVHRCLVVTTVWHTARALRIFRREAKDLNITMVAAPDPYWINGRWWTNREGRKEWLLEVSKTIADFFGI